MRRGAFEALSTLLPQITDVEMGQEHWKVTASIPVSFSGISFGVSLSPHKLEVTLNIRPLWSTLVLTAGITNVPLNIAHRAYTLK